MSQFKILIVEDNDFNRRLLQALLEAHHYQVLQAVNGKQALEIAAWEAPEVILMDINLPDLDGYEITRLLRKNPATSRSIIVAVTAAALPMDRDKALDAGCDDYIAKPIDTRSFPDRLKELLADRDRTSQKRSSPVC